MTVTLDWTALFIFLSPLAVGLVVWIIKKWLSDVLKEMGVKIEASTAPIQKDANGGWSLPDAIRKLDALDKKLDVVHGRITDSMTDIAHLKGRFDQHLSEEKR